MTFSDDVIADADRDTRTLVHVDRADDRAVVTLDDPDKPPFSSRFGRS